MNSVGKQCIHLTAARKFLLGFLKLSEHFFVESFDICYNTFCNPQIKSNNVYYGVPKRESEIPHGFVGIGLNQTENIPSDMRKIFFSNVPEGFELDKLLGNIGEPTFREIVIKNEQNRETLREVFEACNYSKATNKSGGKNNLLNWFKESKPIWEEGDYFVKSTLFRSTPDWRRLEIYKDLISCEWGSAKVLLLIQFWQTSLTFTDRIVNNKTSSIIEYVGGNEESCLPLRLLVKFERKSPKVPNFEIKPTIQLETSDRNKCISVSRVQKNKEVLDPEEEFDSGTKIKHIDSIKFNNLEMVKYIPGKNMASEFKFLENRFLEIQGIPCHLYIDHPNDFYLKFHTRYDKDIIQMVKTCIKGRKYDEKEKLWLFPIETLYESVSLVEFIGGKIDNVVLDLLVNGNNMGIEHELLVPIQNLKDWRKYLPKVSHGTWYRHKIKFDLSNLVETCKENSRDNLQNCFYLSFVKDQVVESQQSEIIRSFRNNKISVKWDSKKNCWSLPIGEFPKVITICKSGLEFHFSSIFDQIVFNRIQDILESQSFEKGISELNKVDRSKKRDFTTRNRIEPNIRKKHSIDKEEISSHSESEVDENEERLILSCLGKNDYDNERLEGRIMEMINKIRIPNHIDKIEFLLWPKHYKDWESISFLIVSNDFAINSYHPKLLLSIVSNVMIVSEDMIDYVLKKNTWPDDSFETRFELAKNIPSLESRLYISEGIFCKTKLFIVGSPGNNHFKLCTRLATLGNASFVQDPLLADYIIICDESDPNAIKIKNSVPKKQASKVQNTHGETHSIQVTPKWVYDVVLDFSIIKPTSKRSHKAWVAE
ncbi:hypothetical protein HWI79_2764 [Cryptosporidium felis]|nr:hypothetical protein HWI79_2764 [Cryptosporidium felis]